MNNTAKQIAQNTITDCVNSFADLVASRLEDEDPLDWTVEVGYILAELYAHTTLLSSAVNHHQTPDVIRQHAVDAAAALVKIATIHGGL